MNKMASLCLAVSGASLSLTGCSEDNDRTLVAAQDLHRSTAGVCFEVQPEFVQEIAKLTSRVRADIANAGAVGKYIAYISVPISPRGGGDFATNTAMAARATSSLGEEFGESLFVLNPAAYDLPDVRGKRAGGGDYMAVWADVLGGADGKGGVFDLIYFAGPGDIDDFFGVDATDRLTSISDWLDAAAGSDPAYGAIARDPAKRRDFIRYYGLRASSAYSRGAHDEWNIVSKLNSARAVGEDIAVMYDGKAIEPGDFDDRVDRGYEVNCPA